MIPEQFIDELIARADIADVKSGGCRVGLHGPAYLFSAVVALAGLRHLHPQAFSQESNGFRVGEILDLLHCRYD